MAIAASMSLILSPTDTHMIPALINVNIVDGARDFRMITRQVAEAVLGMNEFNRFSKEMFSWVGFKTKWIEYENKNRIIRNTALK